VCWSFSGAGADTCFGDSGGPLFVGADDAAPVAGITSGGTSTTCTPPDLSYDTDVASRVAWIESAAGGDVPAASCGALPAAGGPGTTILSHERPYDSTTHDAYDFGVSPGTTRLRVTLNGTFAGNPNADLYVRAGAPPDTGTFDCAGTGPGDFQSCDLAAPAGGTWFALVAGVHGGGFYQLTVTTFGGSSPTCGDGVVESGEECDGALGPACDGRCTDTCACATCTTGNLTLARVHLGRRLLVHGTIANQIGLDPRTGFALVIDDPTGARAAVELPNGDPGWTTLPRSHGFRWQGTTTGLRRIVFRKHRTTWQLTVRGAEVPGVTSLARTALRVSLSAGTTCVTQASVNAH
jgi:hypothetical protein